MSKVLRSALAAATLAAAGVGARLATNNDCVAAPVGSVRCLHVGPPPRYLGAGVSMPRAESFGPECVPVACRFLGVDDQSSTPGPALLRPDRAKP